MEKIPTLFERDWNGDRSRVTPQIHTGCEWVLAGEGDATRKLDGTCCMVRDSKLYKRRELRAGDVEPNGFEFLGRDEETEKVVGWVPVGEGPEDKFHREAFGSGTLIYNGTYELVGPKIQGNPEGYQGHSLIPHDSVTLILKDVPRTYDALRSWMEGKDIEGVVWHHPDGRMAKLKLRDFGLKRNAVTA